ncbi:MAG TPA: diguanylate cyclase [Longimicrobium sp.]|nr:diguanylate cyclase [Longimicrobium sp.]
MSGSILVVDEDSNAQQQLNALLSASAHRVVAQTSAQAALEAAASTPFDLVIASVQRGSLDGLELARRLREVAADQEILLVADGPETRARALDAGIVECLQEPLEPAVVKLAVDRCLERVNLRRERARLLDENLEFVRGQSIQQRCLELLSSPDLEWLQERIITELSSLCDAQSAALWLMDDKGALVLKAYRGLTEKQFLSEKLDSKGPLSSRLSVGAPWLSGEGRSRSVWVPLMASGEVMGLSQLSDPLAGDFRPEQLKSARMLADFAAAAVKIGRRFLALQRLGLRDRDTAAYNLSYFTDYAGKEIYKARRYSRTFSLLTLSIDNLPQLRMRLSAAEARSAPRAVIKALSKIVRDSDVIAKASEGEFYLMLPETDYFGAMIFLRRALGAIRDEPEVQELESKLPLAVVAGAATFPKDGEDFDELVHRCRRRMDERRASLQRKLMLDGMGFWDEVELLLGSPNSPKLPVDERAEPSRRGKVSDALFDELQGEIARELSRDPSARGVLYVGGPEVRANLPIVAGLEGVPAEFAPRVYVLGRRADLEAHPGLTPVFLEGDEAISRHEFLFWLSEHAAYGLIQRRGLGVTWGFHTSDTALVDGLIAKLQATYDLQPY